MLFFYDLASEVTQHHVSLRVTISPGLKVRELTGWKEHQCHIVKGACGREDLVKATLENTICCEDRSYQPTE